MANKSIADYMLSNGYNKALEYFKEEADFPEEEEEEVQSKVEDGNQACPTDPNRRSFPWFLPTISVIQFCTHVYMVITEDNRLESPLILNPYRYVTICRRN